MSKTDNRSADEPEGSPNGPEDALSATGMFLGSFRREPDPFESALPPRPPPQRPVPSRTSPSETPVQQRGEFTQLFGSTAPPPPETPVERPSDTARIFSAPAGAPKVKGYSSPGPADSASAEGSFTQLFRSPAAAPGSPRNAPLPAQASIPPFQGVPEANRRKVTAASENPGVTELFRALSPADHGRVEPLAETPFTLSPMRPAAPSPGPSTAAGDSFTVLLQRLTESAPLPQSIDTLQQPAPVAMPSNGRGEYTRVITPDAIRSSGTTAAPPEPAETKIFPVKPEVPKVAAPKLAVPPVPPKSKWQEMVPILLVVNGFLMVVLIVLVTFALMRK